MYADLEGRGGWTRQAERGDTATSADETFWTEFNVGAGADYLDVDFLLKETSTCSESETNDQSVSASEDSAISGMGASSMELSGMTAAFQDDPFAKIFQSPEKHTAPHSTDRKRRRPDEMQKPAYRLTKSVTTSQDDLGLASFQDQIKIEPERWMLSEKDFKPRVIIPKSKKVPVPETQKDSCYWEKRLKNNQAARRSREARRAKENQMKLRLACLERENGALSQRLEEALEKNASLKERLSRDVLRNEIDRVKRENAELKQALKKLCDVISNL